MHAALIESPLRRKPGPIVPPHELVIFGTHAICLRGSRRRRHGSRLPPGWRWEFWGPEPDRGMYCVGSMHPLVFLQRADVSRPRRVGKELRPLRPRDLADIEVAARVDAETVRSEKCGRR